MKKSLIASAMLLLLPIISLANEYVVISNKNMKDLSEGEIKAIFLKKLTIINDVTAVPLNLEAREPLRLEFEQKLLNMNFEKLKSYWTKEHYLGHRPPISMKSQESVKAFVKKVDGAIGYINSSSVDSDLKVLYRWSD
jgi:ABC-type phosphate transport system substrate-binding protein